MSAVNQILSNLNSVKSTGFFGRLFSWSSAQAKLDASIALIENSLEDKTLVDDRLKDIQLEKIELDKKLSEATAVSMHYQQKEAERIAADEARAEAELSADRKRWKTHEDETEASIRSIAEKHVITYIDKYPVKGQSPDNAIQVGGQYIIFDAKSPQSTDTRESFAKNYIPRMVNGIKKYTSKDVDVYPQLFLVVPDDTISLFKETYYNKGTYEVYVIPKAALEPIILAIKEISKYELADALTPTDKNNLVRIIGGLSDYTKRRVNVDGFMAAKAIDLLYDVEKILPGDFKDGIIEFEKTNITNPSTEKRGVYETAKDVHDELKKVAIFPEYTLIENN